MDAASILILLAAVGVNLGSQSANDSPQSAATHHTSYFAGQPGWGPERFENPPPAAAPTYDRYPVAPTGTGVSPPPNVVDRTRMAVTESGNALREGVEAGIQAANRQLYQGSEQVIESTRSAGQEFSEQFQGWAGTAAQPSQPPGNNVFGTSPQTANNRQKVTNPFASAAPATSAAPSTTARSRSGVAPPPSWDSGDGANEPDWPSEATGQNSTPRVASVGSVPAQPESGWTSINSTVAPPALVVPQLVNTPNTAAPPSIAPASVAPLQSMVGGSGPGFPAASSASQPVDRSVLAQSQQPPEAAASDSWAIGWPGNTATQPATIGGRYDTNAATTPAVAGLSEAGAPGQPAATPSFDPWAEKDPWGDNRSKSPAGTTAQRDAAATTGPISGNPAAGTAAATGTPAVVIGDTMVAPGTAPAAGTAVQGPLENQPPWMPLLVVSLSLAGSIGANLFLGWSYMDARQKYRSLVQKTANKFRRAAAAA